MTALLLSALLAGCGGAEAQKQSDTTALDVPLAPGTRVEVATLQPSSARLDINLPGEIIGAEDALLGSAAGGFIERVSVKEGDAVSRGQALIQVNTAVYAAQRQQADANLALAKATVKRTEALGDLASPAQLDQVRTQLIIAESNADLARISHSRSVIRAPFSGVISKMNASKGEIAGPGSPLVRIVQLNPVHVSISVSDRDVVSLKPGMKAAISTEAIGDVFPGTVTHIDPAADLQTRSFTVEIAVDNPDGRLLPGMIASASIGGELASDAVVIPQDWLVTRIDGVGVFVDEDGVARWRDVTPGQIIHDQVVITDGVSVGDRVVFTGHRGLADGDTLLKTREGVCCTNGRVTY
ncbi:MAG: membrane fusion protein (multidrug efflux system) [Myxococcota bacterium]|jgi:membrane fusion protein (multidrug efflux system)